MPPPAPMPVQNKPAAAPVASMKLDLSPIKPAMQPLRLLVYAVEGFGKTTIGAHSDSPFMLMGQAETGYNDLLAAGRVPAVPGKRVDTFKDALAVLDELTKSRGSIKTVVVDSLSTFEDMVMEEVCTEHFGGDWGPTGFQNFGRGYATVSAEWTKLLSRLDRLAQSGCNVIMLAHAAITTFDNPQGASFKRYAPALYDAEKVSLRGATNAFATAILFGNFLTVVDIAKAEQKKNVAEQKGKAVSSDTVRVIYTERRDAFDAKNRYGMEAVFKLPDDPTGSWEAIWSQIVRKDA